MPTATKSKTTRQTPATSESAAVLDNERRNQQYLAVAFENVIDDLSSRHRADVTPAGLVVRPEEWVLIRQAGPTESNGTAAIRTRHDLCEVIERRRGVQRMLDDLGGWPDPIEAARERLREATEVLTSTRADLADLEVEAVDEPALEAQLRVLSRRLTELRSRQAEAASEVTRLQSLHDCLCDAAPPILQTIVAQREQDLGVAAVQAAADELGREIAQHKRWLDRSDYLSPRLWTEPYNADRIVWQFVVNVCEEAINQPPGDTAGKRSLNAKVWHAWLDELEADLPNKQQQLAKLRAEATKLLDRARAPLHAWMNAKRLELDMLQPMD